MERYVTFTDLKQNLREIKEAACEDVVYIMYKGKPAYVFCSFEVYERRMEAARRRGAYRADTEESMRETSWDIRRGKLVDAHEVLVLGRDLAHRVLIGESALFYLDKLFDDDQRLLLGHTLTELAQRPHIGLPINVEYDGRETDDANVQAARKFFSPPCDVLYSMGKEDEIIIRGFARSLDWNEDE